MGGRVQQRTAIATVFNLYRLLCMGGRIQRRSARATVINLHSVLYAGGRGLAKDMFVINAGIQLAVKITIKSFSESA